MQAQLVLTNGLGLSTGIKVHGTRSGVLVLVVRFRLLPILGPCALCFGDLLPTGDGRRKRSPVPIDRATCMSRDWRAEGSYIDIGQGWLSEDVSMVICAIERGFSVSMECEKEEDIGVGNLAVYMRTAIDWPAEFLQED